jgi:hypothetical protein
MSPSLRRAVPAVALALAASALVAPAAGAQPTGGDLYTATAAGGTLTKAPGKAAYTLTLKDPAAKVSAFSDRPARSASTQTLKRFVGDWKANGFTADPPNAALVLDQAPAAHDTYLFELTRPRIARDGDLTFAAKRIGARPAGALEPIAARADRGTPRGFGRASLFIDDSGTQYQLSVTAKTGPDANVVIDFGADAVGLSPSSSWHPTVSSSDAGYTEYSPTSMTLVNSAGVDSETTAAVGLDHQGSGPIVGAAIVPAGTTVTISVDGGAPVTIANGPFSIPV